VGWFRRKPAVGRVDVGTYVLPLPSTPPALDDLVDEAQLIAEQAVRLALANALLMRALREDRAYSETDMLDLARQQFERVAAEADVDAKRDPRARNRVADSWRRERRSEVGTALAARLRAAALNEDSLRGALERARESALNDILSAYGSAMRRRRTADPAEIERRKALVALDLHDLRPAR
jgi:hypothetical protein